MKIFILTEGGKKIGFGHITRCVALAQGFKAKDANCKFIINGDDSVTDFLPKSRYEIFNWITNSDKLFKQIKEAGIVIIDSYLADKELYEQISEILGGSLVIIDDCKRLDYPKGVIVNPSIYGDTLDYTSQDGVEYLLGKDYIILRKEFWPDCKKIINEEVKNILVTLGGMNNQKILDDITRCLNNKFNFNITRVNYSQDKFTARQMIELMQKADVCISAGGQTLNELARIGVPTIGVCMADNQEKHLEARAKLGFIEYAGWHNDLSLLGKIELAIEKMVPLSMRQKMSDAAKAGIDGQGAQRIADYILNKYADNYQKTNGR